MKAYEAEEIQIERILDIGIGNKICRLKESIVVWEDAGEFYINMAIEVLEQYEQVDMHHTRQSIQDKDNIP